MQNLDPTSNLEYQIFALEQQIENQTICSSDIDLKITQIRSQLVVIEQRIIEDKFNLRGKINRLNDNLNALVSLASILIPQKTQAEPLMLPNILSLLKPKMGPKKDGGKELQKVEPFVTWLDNEYFNKQSAQYKVYQKLIETQSLDNSLFIGIRGDGDCGFRGIISSILVQLALHPNFSEIAPNMLKNLNSLVAQYSNTFKGFEKFNVECLRNFNDVIHDPKAVVNLLNDDGFVQTISKMFRFLANAVAFSDFEILPEEVKIQFQFAEGVEEYNDVQHYLFTHANFNVEHADYIPANMFAGIAHIQLIANKLGVGYWIDSILSNDAQLQNSLINNPPNALLKIKLICRDNRHFDVIAM